MALAGRDARSAKAVSREIRELRDKPCEGIRVSVNEGDLSDVSAEIDGPAGTPYEDGLFRLRLSLPPDYPASPPKGRFVTRVFHPNVAKDGDVCVNVLKRDWRPGMGLRHALLAIRCLMIEPFPESALNEDAGKLLLDDYSEYAKRAALMTRIHASGGGGSRPSREENCSGCANTSGGAGNADGGGVAEKGEEGKGSRARAESPSSPATPAMKRSKGVDMKPKTTKTAKRTGLKRL